MKAIVLGSRCYRLFPDATTIALPNITPSGGAMYQIPALAGGLVIEGVAVPDGAEPGDYVYSGSNLTLTKTTNELAARSAEKAAMAREVAKAARSATVSAITVTTTAGRTFDGDEISQGRMARAIIALNAQPQTPVPTVNWVLANDTVIQTNAAELTEALARAGAAQAAVWVI